jgi:DNA-binding response OmpR family regulator
LVARDATVAIATREHFSKVDLELDQVAGGGAALASALDASVALVILDVWVPALDGVLALRALRESASFGTVPIIVLAGSSSEQDIVRCFDLGADDYIVKPFSPAELVARTRRLLKRR